MCLRLFFILFMSDTEIYVSDSVCLFVCKITQKIFDEIFRKFWQWQIWIYFLLYVVFNSQGHITTGSLQAKEPVHTSLSRLYTVNHRAWASNYQLSNIKCLGQDSNQRSQRLKASTLTATSLSPPFDNGRRNIDD